jgi:hypothetical protein
MLANFSDFITESYKNFIGGRDEEHMHAHKHEVHGLIHAAYEKIGGIHGSGFRSPDDMVQNIHMWKIHKHNGKVVAAALYKNKNGRKRVAVATDGSEHGKKALGHIMHQDATGNRAWAEQSGPSLSFLKRHVPDLKKHALSFEHAQKLNHGEELRRPPHDDSEVLKHPELKDHFYQRKIGDHWHTKISIGNPGHNLK